MTNLYPLKFKPILKERVWGGKKLITFYGKNTGTSENIGESWELSGLQGDISEVINGFLEGNNLEEIIEVYMGDLVGEEIYEKFGKEFPLLIKLIDADEDLSIQVHPGNELAKERHHAYGKTEMWYILDAQDNAKIFTGFSEEMNKETLIKSLKNDTIASKLNIEKPEKGDVFFIPAGRIHSIGKGVMLVEIQQTSDITYRMWDWNRKGLDGNPRQLHTELSLDAIDFKTYDSYKTAVKTEMNGTANIIDCEYFTVNIIDAGKRVEKDYSLIDSFIIYICVEGSAGLSWGTDKLKISKGETVLIPAIMEHIIIDPVNRSKILEVYIRKDKKYEN